MPSEALFTSLSSTPEMDSAFSDRSWVTALLRFEAALASVQADIGLLSRPAAQVITDACDAERFDARQIGLSSVLSGTPVLPLVDELRRLVGPEVAGNVHLGATSQDAIDTAMMLLSRDAMDVLLQDLASISSTCAALANRHRLDAMIGRTLLQNARPVSFGLRCANWLVGIVEAALGLRACRERLSVQVGGPVGNLDSYGVQGLELARGVAAELGLAEQVVPWHSVRVRIGQLGAALAMTAGAATKIALDVVVLSSSEIGEVAEADGGPSSSMPHKRNPIRSVEARATFAGAVAQAGLLMGAVPGELERAAGSWQSEWLAVSQCFKFTHATVVHTNHAIGGLRVYPERMLANLRAAGHARPDLGTTNLIIDRALSFYAEHIK